MRLFRRFAGARLLLLGALALLFFGAGIALFLTVPRLLPPLILAERAFALAAAFRVCAQDALPESKTARMTLAIALPVAGAAFCFFFRPLRGDIEEPPQENGEEPLSRFARLAGRGVSGAESAEYFPTGAVWRAPFLADLAAARREIFLEYYIVAEGVLWDEIFRILRERAERGVRVKLLFDAFGCALSLPSRFVREMKKAKIEAKPFRVLAPCASAARRDHRKLAVIDGHIAYVGGINLADEYVGEKLRFGHWKDSALRLSGGVVCDFRQMFLRTWGGENASSAPENICPAAHSAHTMPAIALSDDAEGRIPRAGARILHELCGRAEKTLYFNTPYLAPDGATMRALMRAAAGGTDVRVAIPFVPDKKAVYLLSKRCARILERGGVQVRAYRAGFLHAKSAVCDGLYSLVGSWNLDCRSLYAQAECGALVQSASLAAALERDFLSTWEQCVPLPEATAWERLKAALVLPFYSLV